MHQRTPALLSRGTGGKSTDARQVQDAAEVKDNRRSYFNQMSMLVKSNFQLSDDEISTLLKITRVKLAYNILNFVYSALIKNRGDVDAALQNLRACSKALHETSPAQADGTPSVEVEAESLDFTLQQFGLPLSATSLPSLHWLERLHIVHNAAQVLATFRDMFEAKYSKEYAVIERTARNEIVTIAARYFPEDEIEQACAYLLPLDLRTRRALTVGCKTALEFANAFGADTAEGMFKFSKLDIALPDFTKSARPLTEQVASYLNTLQDLTTNH